MENSAIYNQYQDPQVRALVWSLISPGLVNENSELSGCQTEQWCADIYASLTPFLQQLDQNPSPLHDWLKRYRSWRLGVRFEAYWTFILNNSKINKKCSCIAPIFRFSRR